MLVATSNWLKLTGQEVNDKKSLAFSATNKVRRKPEPLEATPRGGGRARSLYATRPSPPPPPGFER